MPRPLEKVLLAAHIAILALGSDQEMWGILGESFQAYNRVCHIWHVKSLSV